MLIGKLLRPTLDKSIIERPRLMEKIISAHSQPDILLFIASAGYGKTVLMSQCCNVSGNPVIWYQFDAFDDPSVFLKNLIAGIRQYFPDFGKMLLPRIDKSGTLKKTRQIITELFHELSARTEKNVIIALDDFHYIIEPVMKSFIEELLNNLPAKVKVCLASRTSLPFSLSRLAVEGRVIIIDNQTIRFTRDEIVSYLGVEIPQDTITEFIEKQTEGWPVALRLMKNAIPDNKFWELAEDKQLFDYLADEVLRHLPDNIQQFLLETSVLDILTPEHCDLLREKKDSGEILDLLNNQQLFVTPLADGGTYRYHQLFREFLLNRLGKNNKRFFYKAGTVARSLGNIENAVKYFNIAGAFEETIRLVIENGKKTLERGHWQTVKGWLSGLSPSQISSEPWLILFQGELEIYMGKLVESERLLRKASAMFKQQGDMHGLSESLSQQARVLRSRGHYSESIKLLDQALSNSLTEDFQHRFDLSVEKGFALVLAGRFDESETELTEALKIAEDEGDNYLIACFSESLSNLYFLKGDYSKSMEMYQRAVNVSIEPVQTSYYMRDSVALIYRDWGELDRALEHAVRSIAVKEKLGLVEVLPYAYYQLASIQTDLGDINNAEINYRRSISIAKETGGEQVFRIMSMSMLAKLLLVKNQFVEAGSLANEAMELSKSQSPYVMAFTKEMVAPVLLQTGKAPEAVRMLFESAEVLEQIGAKYPMCIAYGALTTLLFMKGDTLKAGQYARKCLELAARENYLQIFITTYDLFQPVLKVGLEHGIETLFIQRVLVRLGSRGMELLLNLATAPDPEVRRRIIIPLAEIGGVKVGKIFQSLVDDPNQEVKEFARQMAGRLGIVRVAEFSKPVIQLLRFDMLGNLKIYINGVESTTANWKTSKSRDLLTYLAHCGEAVTKDRILEDLWPDMRHEKRSQLFHTTLYYLRKFLNQTCKRKDIVHYSGGKYRLREEIFTTDRDRFERLLRKVKKSDESPETKISCLNEAIELYSGDYLAGMDYAWLILIREHLELLYLQALKQLSHYYMEKQEYDDAINYLHLLAKNDPFAEDVFCMLMESYASIGNLKMVNEIYQSLMKSLDKELGIMPSADTRGLFKQLSETGLKVK